MNRFGAKNEILRLASDTMNHWTFPPTRLNFAESASERLSIKFNWEKTNVDRLLV